MRATASLLMCFAILIAFAIGALASHIEHKNNKY